MSINCHDKQQSTIYNSQSEIVSGIDSALQRICVTGVASRRYLLQLPLTDPNSGVNVIPPATVNVFRTVRRDFTACMSKR